MEATEWFARLELARALTRPKGVEPLRADFIPHQLSALSAFLGRAGEEGLVIADEVGTGKTYAAGHIIRDAILNAGARKILVLCPARLKDEKWRRTLRRDFGLSNAASLRGKPFQEWFEETGNVHHGVDIAVVSYHLADHSDKLDVPGLIAKESELQRLDMVVIDEAQHLFKTADNRRELCKLASRLADRRVVLTATPIYRGVKDLDVLHALARPHGKTDWDREAALEEQRRIMSLVKDIDGRRPEGNELLDVLGIEGIDTSGQLTVEAAKLMLMDKAPLSQWMIKTRSEQVGQLSIRRPILHALPLPADDGDVGWDYDLEKEIHRPDSKTIYNIIRTNFKHHVHALIFESSPKAFLSDQIHDHELRGAPPIGDVLDDVRGLVEVLRERENADPKPECLKNIIREAGNQNRRGTVVYSHYSRTQRHLKELLEREKAGWVGLAGTHTEPDVLMERMAEFRKQCGMSDGRHPVLIISDKLAEGVDLQCADSLVVYDCGSNPMKLEQLVGRIDRIGQTAEQISIHYLAIEGSVHLENLRLMNERLVEYAKVQGAGRPLLPPELDDLKEGNHSEEVLRQLREATKQRALEQAATLDLSGFGNEQLPEEFELKPSQEVLASFHDALDKTVKKFGGEASEGRITFPFDRVCRSLLDSVNGEEGKLPQPHGDQLIVAADEFIPKDVHVHRWLLEQAKLDFQLPSGPMHGIGSPSAILRITAEGGEGFVGLAQEDGRWGLCSVHAVYTRLSKPTLSDKGRAFSDQNTDAIQKKILALGPSFASDTGRSDAQKRLRRLSIKQRNYEAMGIDTGDIKGEVNQLVQEINRSTHKIMSSPILWKPLLVVEEE